MNNFISFNDFKKNSTPNVITDDSLNKNKPSALNIPQQQLNSEDRVDLSNELQAAKRQNGLIEKLADKIKSTVNFGISSKKIEQDISENKNQEEIKKEIKNYRRQQENTAQATGDVASSIASMGAFFGIKQSIQKIIAKKYTLNKDSVDFIFSEIKDNSKSNKFIKDAAEFAQKHIGKKSTPIVFATIGAMIVGGFVKKNLLKLNRIGTKQYKAQITPDMNEEDIKYAKKDAKRARKNANKRNKWSGRINGLMTPMLLIGGGVMAPVYAVVNSLNRYFIGTREDRKEKSFNSYIENLKNSPITTAASAVAIAVPAFMKGKADKVFEVNLEKTVNKLKQATLSPLASYETTYKQLENVLFNDDKIREILDDSSLSVSQKIGKLTECNIFAVKFKQINADSDSLTRALKSECPSTRTISEAQQEIDKVGLKGKYTIVGSEPVGVGTVAETYLAKDADGKQVCIKMLKKGIDGAKIEKDKNAFITMINDDTSKTQQEKEFLIRNVENIAQGVLQEVDLSNEMVAANELAKVTRKANVVKPIEVNGNVYVMEKAKGVNLSDFATYMRNKGRSVEEISESIKTCKSDIAEFEAKLKLFDENIDAYDVWLKSDPGNRHRWYVPEDEAGENISKLHDILHSSGFDRDDKIDYSTVRKKLVSNINDKNAEVKQLEKAKTILQNNEFKSITTAEAKKLLLGYQDVLVEQFSKVDGGEKIIHGDIHPGNIFIDIDALKRGDKKFFTLIDTGNTVKQSPESAIRLLNLTKYISNADTESIVELILKDAKLPPDIKSMEEAKRLVLDELNKIFFDDKTKLDTVTISNLYGITDGIMQKLNIIPSDAQGNLTKAKESANRSFGEFKNVFFDLKEEELSDGLEKMIKNGTGASSLVLDTADLTNVMLISYPRKQKKQEMLNLLSPKAKALSKGSRTKPAKNSEEYLTYYLKQGYNQKNSEKLF